MGGKSELQIEIVSKKFLGKLLNGNLNTAYTEHNADPVYGEEKSTSDTVPDIPTKNVNRDMSEALMQSNKKPSVVSIVKEAMAEFKIEKRPPGGFKFPWSKKPDESPEWRGDVEGLPNIVPISKPITEEKPKPPIKALREYEQAGGKGTKKIPSRRGVELHDYELDPKTGEQVKRIGWKQSTFGLPSQEPLENIEAYGGRVKSPLSGKVRRSSEAEEISDLAAKTGTTSASSRSSGTRAGKTFSTIADRGRGKEEESYRSLTGLYGEGKYTPDSDQPKTTSWWDRAGKDSGPEFDERRFDVGASRAELRGRPSFRGAGSNGTTDDDWGDEGEYGGYTEEERSRLAYQAPVVPKKEEKKKKKIINEGKIVSTSESGLPEGRKPGLAPTLQSEAGSPGSYSKFKVDDEGKRIPGEYENYNKYGFTMDLKREDDRWVRDIQAIDPDIADKFFQGNEATAKRFFETASMDDLVDRFTKSLDNGGNMNNINILNLVKEVITDIKKAKKGGGPRPSDAQQHWREEMGPDVTDAKALWQQSPRRDRFEKPSDAWKQHDPRGDFGYEQSIGGGVKGKGLQKQVPPAMTTAPKKPPMATSATGPANVGGVNTGIPIKMSKGSKNKERQVPARKRPRPTSPKEIENMAKSALLKLEKQGPSKGNVLFSNVSTDPTQRDVPLQWGSGPGLGGTYEGTPTKDYSDYDPATGQEWSYTKDPETGGVTRKETFYDVGQGTAALDAARKTGDPFYEGVDTHAGGVRQTTPSPGLGGKYKPSDKGTKGYPTSELQTSVKPKDISTFDYDRKLPTIRPK